MIAGVFFVLLFLMLFSGVPIAFGMGLVGTLGFMALTSVDAGLAMVGQVLYDTTLSYQLSILPLFVLMGNFISHARMSDDLYAAANTLLGHKKGGLAMATIAACSGFSAVCGSSLATVATMSKVAIPQMRQYGYLDGLAAGAVAAGGTLGILIPPSVVLILYGIITENNIAALFAAGLLPGILGILLYIVAVRAVVAINPKAGPQGPRYSWRERAQALSKVWALLLLFVIVLGGIYGGVFTSTEAAGIGAFGAFVIALLRGGLTFRVLISTLLDSARTTALLFMVLVGAILFGNFVNIAQFPQALSGFVTALELDPLQVILVITLIYLVLGCLLESMSLLLLTVPIFYPVAIGAGIDPIWFGIYTVIVIEIGMITPPIGLNAFILKATVADIPLSTIFKGLLPFIAADIGRLALLIVFPSIALFLVKLFY
ncbi:TRAP transporter large permease [Pusillimonas sp.]|uniref:TRAP transporter large permease n=1 Tax=Pusillimonas sp. TaxID=3040095 RepID=UPI0029AB59B8|nr:TRAP transporter large permease [Pusillimonas sp.]MDX3895261.1 TRAP transporter large permease [Pusillimonas sp.]